jgi:hypothetical protein
MNELISSIKELRKKIEFCHSRPNYKDLLIKYKYIQYIDLAKSFFFKLHDIEVNQKYDKDSDVPLPYSFHLNTVGKNFIFLYNNIFKEFDLTSSEYYMFYICGLIGAYGHDSIEDARLSYNGVKDIFGDIVADIIFGCTESTGKDRKERHDSDYFIRMMSKYNSQATITILVKIADMLKNFTYGLLTCSNMINKYKKEYINFEENLNLLYEEEYRDKLNIALEIYKKRLDN